MRPTRLSIEGLTAFRAQQKIDFGDLDLFVITGPTGSGKTSILDAITFALYGDVCRVKSGELRDLISHGATHVRVSLDFRINGTAYRVARRMRKAGAGHEVQFVRVEDDQEVVMCDTPGGTAVNKTIEEVLGLDFSAFTKAVLLPQGAFHEFLKGDASARRKILIDLLDLNRYLSAGGKARSQASTLSARLDEKQKLIEREYGDATTERLKEAKDGLKAARAAYKEHQAAEKQANEQGAAAKAGEAIVEAASTAEDAFRELEAAMTDNAEELGAITKQLNERKKAVVNAAKAVRMAEKARVAAEAAVEKAVTENGDEALIARLQAAAEDHKTENETLINLKDQLAEVVASVASAEKTHTASQAAQKTASLAEGRMGKKAEAAQAAFDGAILLLECARAVVENELAQHELATAREGRDAAIRAAEGAQTHLHHLQTADLAATLRAGLKPGDACPVCERAVETLPKIDRQAASDLKRAEADAGRTDEKRLAAEATYGATATKHEAAAQRLATAKAALMAGAKPIPLAEAEAKRAAAEIAAVEAQERFESAQQAYSDTEKRAAEADASRRVAKARVQGVEKEVKGATQRLEKAERELLLAFPAKLPADVDGVLEKRLIKLGEARKVAAEAAKALTAAEKGRVAAVEAEHESESLVSDLAKRFAEMRTRAEMSLRELEVISSATLPPLPGSRESLDAQVQRATSCCRDYIKAAQEAAQAGALARSKAIQVLADILAPLELERDADLGQLLDSIAKRREEIHTTFVQAEQSTKLVNERIANRVELEKEIKDDAVRCARFKTLADELRQDHFIAFVLGESMERLATLASVELLRISGGRYSLVPDEGGFDVIDHHNANERRSVATLSGGETFLASLALALALAGSVRDLAGAAAAARLDAIFIDEGFGALDPETLEVVLDALERLGEGERMVGVISHVDELAQRIPQGLRVSKNGGVSTVAAR